MIDIMYLRKQLDQQLMLLSQFIVGSLYNSYFTEIFDYCMAIRM